MMKAVSLFLFATCFLSTIKCLSLPGTDADARFQALHCWEFTTFPAKCAIWKQNHCEGKVGSNPSECARAIQCCDGNAVIDGESLTVEEDKNENEDKSNGGLVGDFGDDDDDEPYQCGIFQHFPGRCNHDLNTFCANGDGSDADKCGRATYCCKELSAYIIDAGTCKKLNAVFNDPACDIGLTTCGGDDAQCICTITIEGILFCAKDVDDATCSKLPTCSHTKDCQENDEKSACVYCQDCGDNPVCFPSCSEKQILTVDGIIDTLKNALPENPFRGRRGIY